MIELKKLRKPREKHFLKSDKTMIAYVYDYDIHYLKDGKYEEIDNTLLDRNNKLINKNNFFKTTFLKDKETRELVDVTKDDHYFKMFLNTDKNKNAIIQKNKNTVKYIEVLSDIDIEYDVIGTKLKEAIILKNKETVPQELSFTIKTDLDLDILPTKEVLVKKGNDIIYTITPPFMTDAIGNYNSNIYYELLQNNNNYLLTLKLDSKWLQSQNTIYPVTVDPTIVVNSSSNIYDTYISSLEKDSNKNNEDKLKIGVDQVDGKNDIYRTLIKFDLPTIPTGSIVTDARLSLISHMIDFGVLGNIYSSRVTDVHMITSNWNEATATWNNMANKYESRIEDCVYTIKSSVDTEDMTELKENQFNITNIVKRWYAGEPNYGVMLKKHTEVYEEKENYSVYYSKSHGLSSVNPTPLLTIHYQNQNGLEDYYSYDEQIYEEGSSYINRNNGNLTTYFDLNTTLNGKLPAQVSLYYNTNDFILNNDYGYGLGYKLNYYQTIKEVTIDEIDYLEYLDTDGTLHYFFKEENKDSYLDEDGLGLVAVKENNNYEITDKNKNKMLFTKNQEVWYLTKITNSNNDSISISYDNNNKITKITDGDNQEINITYENNKITLASKYTTTTLNYLNNKVSSLVTKSGTTTFTYNNLNLLEKIIDLDGQSIKFEYYNTIPYRVSKVSEYGLNNTLGKSLTYKYNYNSTTVKDHKNRITTYAFNSNGSVISVSNLDGTDKLQDGYAKTQNYDLNSGYLNNKLLTNNPLVKYVKNYIPNSSFEQENTLFFSDGETVVRSSTIAHSGNHSLRIIIPGLTNGTSASLDVPKGKYYTFSAYIKASNNVHLKLSYFDTDDNIVVETTTTDNNEEFTRHDVSIFYPLEATSPLTVGVSGDLMDWFYIDDLQLEEGQAANYYNMIENSDFSDGMTGWTINSSVKEGEEVTIPADEVVTLASSCKALKMTSDPFVEKILTKTITVNGKKNDTYNLSFWYKNLGIEPDYQTSIYGNYNMALINFGYTEEVPSEPYVIKLNLHSNEWQFFSGNFTALEDHDSIIVTVMDLFNANEIYLANFSLYKDLGNSTFNYDEKGNLITAIDKNNAQDTFKYDKNNQLISSFDPLGNNLKYEYDNNITDRLLGGISPTGILNTIKYDNYGNPIETRIKNTYVDLEQTNNYCHIRAKGSEDYLKVSFEDLQVLLKEDDCSHDVWLLEKQDNNYRIKHPVLQKYINCLQENVILAGAVDNNSLFSIVKCDNGSIAFNLKDTYKYLSVNNDVLSIKEITSTSSVNDEASIQFYLENTERPNYIKSKAIYSDDGKVITKVVDNLGNVTNFDINSNNGLVNSITDPINNKANYTYNNKEQLTSVTKGDTTIEYQYNNQNMLSKIVTDNKDYTFEYDDFLNTKSVKVNNNTLITNTYAENNGPLMSSVYGNEDTINFEYDNFDRLNKIIKMNDTYNYYYNNLGSLGKVIANNDLYKYNYDFAKRLTRYQFNDYLIDYQYDINNNITKRQHRLMSKAWNVLNYEYNQENALTKLSFDNNAINYKYDELGRLIEVNINDVYKKEYSYINKGALTSLLVKQEKIGDDLYEYQYNKLNNITRITKNGKTWKEYRYDNHEELIREDDYEHNKTTRYQYDNSGNILAVKEYELNTYNLLKKDAYEYTNNSWKDQLTKYNADTITYDAIGNPLTIGNNISLGWINGRQLDTYVDTIKNISASYQYNKDGIRIKKTINNTPTEYYVENNQIIFETRNNDMLYYIRDNIGNLIALLHNNNLYYYLLNIQGDVVGLLDENYNLVASYKYDSFGKIIAIEDGSQNDISNNPNHIASINPFRYRSYYYDNETELYYLNSRYYSPEIGRFINADAIIKDLSTNSLSTNMYSYCKNNPIIHSDKNGQWAIFDDIAAGIVGLFVGVGSQLITDVTTSVISGSWQFSSWETYAGAAIGGIVGGITTLYAGPVIGAAVGAGTSTLVGQTLENITGKEERSFSEIATNTIIDATIGAVTNKIIPVKVSGITSGRNSMAAVYQAGLTKLGNRTATKMSFKVMTKGTISGIVSDLPVDGIMSIKNFLSNLCQVYNQQQKPTPTSTLYWCAP